MYMMDCISNSSNICPPNLVYAVKNIYAPLGIPTSDPLVEASSEGHEYQASRLRINGNQAIFRVAKTTQDRPGQFVTLWKRPQNKIVPFNINDNISFVIVDVRGESDDGTVRRGQFIFDKEILIKQGILESSKAKGKMAFRVFPPWSQELIRKNPVKTQKMSASAKKNTTMAATILCSNQCKWSGRRRCRQNEKDFLHKRIGVTHY